MADDVVRVRSEEAGFHGRTPVHSHHDQVGVDVVCFAEDLLRDVARGEHGAGEAARLHVGRYGDVLQPLPGVVTERLQRS